MSAADFATIREALEEAYEALGSGDRLVPGTISEAESSAYEALESGRVALARVEARADRLAAALEVVTELITEVGKYLASIADDVPHFNSDALSACERGAKVGRDALAADQECEHEWVDARNEAVISGEWCRKCNAIRAADQEQT